MCVFCIISWSLFLILIFQDPAEGVWTVKGTARPTRGPCWKPLGVRGPLHPPGRGRSSSRGKAAATTQGPLGGPHAHLGGTQQTAGVSAPPPPTATAPGDITLTLICWTVLSREATGYGWEEAQIDIHRLICCQNSHPSEKKGIRVVSCCCGFLNDECKVDWVK